ncbi:MAG: toll/interleukin-1 receptor domain-containing protein, partial [Candidatus Korobacteraceae bacterium]
MARHTIFLSHAKIDAGPALVLKQWLLDRFPGFLDVFVSSDFESIEQGREWYEKIRDALKACDLGLVLVTPNSIQRPWVSFEIGGLKLIDKDVIPVCVDVSLERLPVYISRNQACQYDIPDDRLALLSSIASHLDLPKEYANKRVTSRAAHKAPLLTVTLTEGSVPAYPVYSHPHEIPIERVFPAEDRWTTVIYTCRATFTQEVCPSSQEDNKVAKSTNLHIPVDELQTACLAINHLMPVASRHEDDAISTVMCSMEAEKALANQSHDGDVPELLDRDLII